MKITVAGQKREDNQILTQRSEYDRRRLGDQRKDAQNSSWALAFLLLVPLFRRDPSPAAPEPLKPCPIMCVFKTFLPLLRGRAGKIRGVM